MKVRTSIVRHFLGMLGVLALGFLPFVAKAQVIELHTHEGAFASSRVGAAVAFVGDLDGDGSEEYAIGKPFAAGLGLKGQVLIYGSTHAPFHTLSAAGENGEFGNAIAGLGDFDGDGRPDIAVGAPADQVNRGYAAVISGTDFSIKHSSQGADFPRLGHAIAMNGDFNNDGYADFVYGAPLFDAIQNIGEAVVISGFDESVLFRMEGVSPQDFLGWAVAYVGDVDGDSYSDLAIGVPGNDQEATNGGAVHLISGRDSSTLFSYFGTVADRWAGSSIAAIGDVNGDSKPDIVIGAPADPNNPGYVVVISGADGSEIWKHDSDQIGAEFGFSLSGAGDIDEDGVPDVLVGQPERHNSAPGRVLVLSGTNGSEILTISGENPGDYFGYSVAGGAI